MWSPLALLLAFLMACTGSTKPPGGVAPGTPFTLSPGQTAKLKDGSLQLTFKEVKNDSRCPQDVQCVWEGDATVVITSSGNTYELHTSKDKSAAVGSHTLNLVGLAPAPRSGTKIPQPGYKATLTIDAP